MRVIVCGSREWTDADMIVDVLAALPGDAVIVHGGARGADRLAHDAAIRLLLPPPEVHRAKWRLHGRSAGPIRNREMLQAGADKVIAFWNGSSKGTLDMIQAARLRGVPVDVYTAFAPGAPA